MSSPARSRTAFALWRRLDAPGHDACRVDRTREGWELRGTAVFVHEGLPASLAYGMSCDSRWLSRSGRVQGWIGDRTVDIDVERAAGRSWMLGGRLMDDLDDRPDLDFGFTPATNLLQLRRLSLDIGDRADAPAAWLDLSSASLGALDQVYERRSESAYWYEAPRFDYAGTLIVDPDGFVRQYPGLWERVL